MFKALDKESGVDVENGGKSDAYPKRQGFQHLVRHEDDDQNRGSTDDQNQKRAPEIGQSNEIAAFKSGFQRGVEPAENGKTVGQCDGIEKQQNAKEDPKEAQLGVGGQEADIAPEDKADNQHDQPVNRALLEVLDKGFKKGLEDSFAAIVDVLIEGVIHCRGGSTGGDNRDAQQQPKDVQKHQIEHQDQRLDNIGIMGKQLFHNGNYLRFREYFLLIIIRYIRKKARKKCRDRPSGRSTQNQNDFGIAAGVWPSLRILAKALLAPKLIIFPFAWVIVDVFPNGSIILVSADYMVIGATLPDISAILTVAEAFKCSNEL